MAPNVTIFTQTTSPRSLACSTQSSSCQYIVSLYPADAVAVGFVFCNQLQPVVQKFLIRLHKTDSVMSTFLLPCEACSSLIASLDAAKFFVLALGPYSVPNILGAHRCFKSFSIEWCQIFVLDFPLS